MVAIKDFGMPSCCENCNMCNNRNLDTFYCSITLNDVNIDEKAHDCPLVEIEERKVGEWCKQNDDYFDWYECSECGYGSEGEMQYSSEYDVRTKYCPNCGCRMESGE